MADIEVANEWKQAEEAEDKERMAEIDREYCWLDYAGEPCTGKDVDEILIELRQEIQRLTSL